LDVDAILNHHLAAVIGLGSLAWAGHLIPVSIPVDILLRLGCDPLSLPEWWQNPRSRIELSTPVWWHSLRCLHSELDWPFLPIVNLSGRIVLGWLGHPTFNLADGTLADRLREQRCL
jgi:hypothetical protein